MAMASAIVRTPHSAMGETMTRTGKRTIVDGRAILRAYKRDAVEVGVRAAETEIAAIVDADTEAERRMAHDEIMAAHDAWIDNGCDEVVS